MGLRQTFAKNLKSLRAQKEMSQEALAYAAGLDRTYISSLERCIYSPTLDTVEDLAKALGVDPIALFVTPVRKR